MATKRGKTGREERVVLGEDVRIGRAREIVAELTAAARTAKTTVVIEATSVGRVDAAGLQAIAACVVHWRTAGTRWRWDNPADALRTAARLAGLQTALELE